MMRIFSVATVGCAFAYRYLCTVRVCRTVLPDMSHRLNDICKYYHIEPDHHKADSDSHACALILLRYMQDDVNVNGFIRVWWVK